MSQNRGPPSLPKKEKGKEERKVPVPWTLPDSDSLVSQAAESSPPDPVMGRRFMRNGRRGGSGATRKLQK